VVVEVEDHQEGVEDLVADHQVAQEDHLVEAEEEVADHREVVPVPVRDKPQEGPN